MSGLSAVVNADLDTDPINSLGEIEFNIFSQNKINQNQNFVVEAGMKTKSTILDGNPMSDDVFKILLQQQIDNGTYIDENGLTNAEQILNYQDNNTNNWEAKSVRSYVNITSERRYNADFYYLFRNKNLRLGPYVGFSNEKILARVGQSRRLGYIEPGYGSGKDEVQSQFVSLSSISLNSVKYTRDVNTTKMGVNFELSQDKSKNIIINPENGFSIRENNNSSTEYGLSLRVRASIGMNRIYEEGEENLSIINSGPPLSASEFEIRDVNDKVFNELMASAVFSNGNISWTLNYQTDTYNGGGKDRNHSVSVGFQAKLNK